MVLDSGRIKHRLDLMHRSVGSNGLAVPSNWRASADGLKNVVWSPESASSVSYGSNSNDVASAGAAGASTLVSRADHVHRGLRTVTSNGSNGLFGDVNLVAGTGMALGVSGQNVTLTNIIPAGSGGGGGGGSGPTDYYSPASGVGAIVIPGLAGSVNVRVAAVNDDEFDTTDASDPLTGWTTLGAPTHDINSTRKSRYYVSSSAASVALQGIYKTAPSIPFTVTCHLNDWTLNSSASIRAGVFIGEAGGAGKISSIANANFGSVLQTAWTNRTTFSANNFTDNSVGWYGIHYLRIVVTLSTSVAFWVSRDGEVFTSVLSGHNPGFTVGIAGLFINPFNALTEANFDWIRFT